MYKIMLSGTPDRTWVSEEKSCIDLYADKDITLKPNQIGILTFGDFRYDFGKDIVGVPFCKNRKYKLYYPNGFKLSGSGLVRLTIDNRGTDTISIKKGEYLSTLRLMTTQFFELMRRNDGSDRGLRSAFIKIEYKEDENQSN